MMLLVVDIGLSNLASVKRAFEIVGGEVVISAASVSYKQLTLPTIYYV